MTIPLIRYILPKDKELFNMLEKAALNMQASGATLLEYVNSDTVESRNILYTVIEELENKGDDITHLIYQFLDKKLFTPFERADIYRLVSCIDDVVDYIYASAKQIKYYNLDIISPDMIKLSELIKACTDELRTGLIELQNMQKMRDISNCLVRVNSLENSADEIFDKALGKLFSNEKDAIQLIKSKEILASLEMATDKCEEVAGIMESIMIKIN